MQLDRPGKKNASRAVLAPAWALVVLAIVAPQVLGGATPETELAILVLACATCVWCAVALRRSPRPLGLSPLAGLGACAATAWTLLQLIPVPCSWLAAWDPERVRVLTLLSTLHAFDAPRCTLSAAPGAGWSSAALAATLGALLLSATAISRAGQRKLLLYGVALSSVAMTVVALAHTVVNADRVFDWYLPKQAKAAWLLAPLLNSNHLAGHLALGFPLCLAFGLQSKRVDVRVVWLGLSFLVLATGLFTLSRAGSAALVSGGVAYLFLHFAGRRRKEAASPSLRPRLPIGAIVCVGIFGVAAYFTADLLSAEFSSQDATTSKLKLMRDLLPLIASHPLAGVGRGALGDVSPAVMPGPLRVLFAENMALQWVIEWGAPATILVLALVGRSLARVRLRSEEDWALLFGFLALCAQNLVDYSLELAGVGSVAAIALGTLVSRERAARSTARRVRPELRKLLFISCAAALVCTVVAAPLLAHQSRAGLRGQLQHSLDDGAQFSRVLRTALEAYPLDPTFLILGAARAVRADRRDAPAWLNLAMELAPNWADPHVQAAYFLEHRGALSQATLELRLGLGLETGEVGDDAGQFLVRHPTADVARNLLPDHSEFRQVLAETFVADLIRAKSRPAELDSFLAYVLSAYPEAAFAHARYVEMALGEGHNEIALARARTMYAQCPADPQGLATLMTVLIGLGHPADALRQLDRAAPPLQASRDVLLAALSAAGAEANTSRLSAVSEDLFARFGSTAEQRAELHRRVSEQYEAAGALGQALSHAQQSYELVGNIDMLERVHRLAQRAGMMQVALRAATELCHVGHHREAYCQ